MNYNNRELKLYVNCPECNRIVKKDSLVSIETNEKFLGFLPKIKKICNNCVEDHNKDISKSSNNLINQELNSRKKI